MATLSNEERAERLEQAAALVREVVGSLDNSSTPCSACGAGRFHSWTEHLMVDALGAALQRIERAASSLTEERRRDDAQAQRG